MHLFPRFPRGRAFAFVAGLTATMTVAFTAPALAHGMDEVQERHAKHEEQEAGESPPLAASSNVNLVDTIPETQAISGVFSKSAPYFYISSLDSISVVDVSDPLHPKIVGVLPDIHFENEAMTYGERKINGKIHRFVLIGVSTHEYAPTQDPAHVYTGNGEVVVVDVTDPTNPYIRSRVTNVPTSTHTVMCVNKSDCRYAYTAGTSGHFSIIDLTDLDNPKVVDKTLEASPKSPAAGPNPPDFESGAGHKWNFDGAGYGLHTGSGGTAIFDVSDPLHPKLLNTTNELGTQSPWNDFIHHNSARPNAKNFEAGAAPSIENGNVLLVTEEDYLDTDCQSAGSFETWYVPKLDGKSSIRPLDRINPVSVGEGGSLPHMTFCSAHWFDFHPSGIVVQGFYQGGVRLIDVRDPRHLKEYGYFTTGSEVWDTYWVPERTKSGRIKGDHKTNIVYAVNFERGVDVLTVDLPKTSANTQNATDASDTTSATSTTPSSPTMLSSIGPAGGAMAGLLLFTLTAVTLTRIRRRPISLRRPR